MSHYGDPNKGFEGNTGRPASFISCEQGGPHRDHKQVDDWRMFKSSKEGQVTMGQSKVKNAMRTSVDCEHDNRNHQDHFTLARTQDPSPPNDDGVGNN